MKYRYIANNIDEPFVIREYKKRFDIEEMFKDFKAGGFNLEDIWSKNIQYVKMLYFCICVAYCWMITLGTSCTKDKKNKVIGATKNLTGKQVRAENWLGRIASNMPKLFAHWQIGILPTTR